MQSQEKCLEEIPAGFWTKIWWKSMMKMLGHLTVGKSMFLWTSKSWPLYWSITYLNETIDWRLLKKTTLDQLDQYQTVVRQVEFRRMSVTLQLRWCETVAQHQRLFEKRLKAWKCVLVQFPTTLSNDLTIKKVTQNTRSVYQVCFLEYKCKLTTIFFRFFFEKQLLPFKECYVNVGMNG